MRLAARPFTTLLLHCAGAARFERLEAVGEQALKTYDQPTPTELRTGRVYSSALCWAAWRDRLGKIAVVLVRTGPALLEQPCRRRNASSRSWATARPSPFGEF
jgi:hypothetical protein